uniref:Uncharacterized protein n=1 Tax=Anguilla anguilla TaxID=7936 RepID=A0A0E9VTU5_ANGAN
MLRPCVSPARTKYNLV